MMARRLREIGVYSEDDLRKVGPLMAFAALRARFPRDVSLIALYAMEAALVGVDWRALPPGRKAELRLSAALGHSDR
jgi:DNA transformation protein